MPLQKYETLSSKLFHDSRFKNNVYFLKQSKVGGTTISSVLHKIAEKYGAVLVPQEIIFVNKKTRGLEVSQERFEKLVGSQRLSFYDERKARLFYFRHCGIWDYSRRAPPVAEKLFKQNDTAFLTIIRHPVKKYQSLKQWLGEGQKKVTSEIMSFAKKCPYLESSGCGQFVDILPCMRNNKNCVGGRYSVFNISRAMNYLKQFDLVMITELMSESIVVMADMLGFPVEELGTVKLKAVTSKFHKYSQTELELLEKYYQSEIKFYNLAVQMFLERKNLLGDDLMARKITELEEANSRTERACGYEFVAENISANQPQSRFKMKMEDILWNPLKMVECLPLLDDPRNNIESHVVEALEYAHRSARNTSINTDRPKMKHYQYSLLEFFKTFKNKSSSILLNQELFF